MVSTKFLATTNYSYLWRIPFQYDLYLILIINCQFDNFQSFAFSFLPGCAIYPLVLIFIRWMKMSELNQTI